MNFNFGAGKKDLFLSLFFLFDISSSPLYHYDISKESKSPFFARQLYPAKISVFVNRTYTCCF
ncbi:MAG: hypothetical protein D3925_15555 [Candidatus Electrothrix sp. AR5]|nr:hypothetical protein [Candidatus Electrothrix sp. AR5]